ncbi:hypothetical protein KUW09_24505 [Mameliella alba]|nr:hypothetical protein [Antarctobacter heliothermus]MBY6147235.1 hypothetical protein [Mameliella alba]MCA0957318.1 hypothetical protein [Mameliella alba]
MIGWYHGFQIGQESHQSHSAEAYKNYSNNEIAEKCALSVDVATHTKCIANAVRNAREQQRAEQDLDAQQQMSFWAKWMLIATVAMAAITLFGVVFVWHTLEATREMARDTKTMAKDTREIGQAQARVRTHSQ